MRRLLLLLLLCFVSLPMQSIAQGGCDIELENAILRLIQAQRAADQGDDLTASSILTSVQGDLDSMLSGCDTIRLTEKFVNPDETLAFLYPDGWRVSNLDRDVYVIVTSSEIIDLLDSDLPEEIAPGEAAIALQLQPLGDETFDEAMEDIRDGMARDMTLLSQMSETTIGGRRYIAGNIALNDKVSGRLGFIDFSDAEVPAIALVLGLADSNSLPIIEVYTDALMQSIQYPPQASLRNTGVSLESISYSNAITVSELDNIDTSSHMILSPDGSSIAYQSEGELCLYEIDATTEDCTPIPERFRGRIPLLQWSPDGQYIIFQEDALRMFVDADIWLYDVETQIISNLTDDGDAEFGLGEFEEAVWLDTPATWGPDNQIYLLRTSFQANDTLDDAAYELLKVDPDSGDITLIQDLTGQFEIFSVFNQQGYSLDGVMSVSPDAAQLMILVMERDRDSRNTGLWLLDLQGIEDPKKIAASLDFTGGYSEEALGDDTFRVLESIAWDAEGTGVFVYATSPDFLNMVYHMDIDSGEIVPMADLSAYSKEDIFDADLDADIPISALVLRHPVLAPDFNGIIAIAGPQPETFITAIPFDGSPGEPTVLYRTSEITYGGDASTVGSDGSVILLGILLQAD